MNSLLVSVCVPTYNHEKYISQCLDSVISQKTSFDYEVLVGEDDSDDNTRKICIEYSKKYPNKIRLFLNDRKNVLYINGKPTGRRNSINLLNSAKGKYIALCEGDDYWTDPYKLQKQVDFLEANEEYVICYHDARVVDENNNLISESKLPDIYKKDASSDDLITVNAWPLTLTVCFRNVLREFPPEIKNVANGDTFLFSMLGFHGRGKYLGDVIKPDVYRIHSTGVWSSISEQERIKKQFNSYIELYNVLTKKKSKEYAKSFLESKILTQLIIFSEQQTLLINQNKKLKREFNLLKSSNSYRIGHFLMWLPGKLKFWLSKLLK